MTDVFTSVILGIVEGITEFLPISSTGHLIIMNHLIAFSNTVTANKNFTNEFDIFIQFGAILSVIIYFRHRIIPFGPHQTSEQKRDIYSIWKRILVGIIPGLVLGLLFASTIQKFLYQPIVVAIMLLVGGVFLIWIEGRKKNTRFKTLLNIDYRTAFFIGAFQCIAMIPGVSRSAATIIGAMLLGASRLAAAEFSFYLAVPTMFGASLYELMKMGLHLSGQEILLLAVGFVVSFLVAWVVIAAFMKFITRHDFKPFGYYRIALCVVIIVGFTIFKLPLW